MKTLAIIAAVIVGLIVAAFVVGWVITHRQTAPPSLSALSEERQAQRQLLAKMGATAAVQHQHCWTRPAGSIGEFRHTAYCNSNTATLLPASAAERVERVLREQGLSPQKIGYGQSWSGGAIGSVRVTDEDEPLGLTLRPEAQRAWKRLAVSHPGEVLVEIQSSSEYRRCWQDTCRGYDANTVFADLVAVP